MSGQNKHTFLLKGIDPNKLLNDYKNGIFPKIFEIKKFPLAPNNRLTVQLYGSSDNDPIFSIKDRNNNSIVIATTGYENYQLVSANDGNNPQIGGRCDFCKRDFNHQNLGYPVAHEEHTLLVDNDDVPCYKIYYVFWMDHETCSFECSLSKVREQQCRHSEFKENSTKNSEFMLHKLFKLTHPNSGVLRPAQDPRLLKSNKGSLTKEEWENPKFLYKPTDRILMLPVKTEYLQKLIY